MKMALVLCLAVLMLSSWTAHAQTTTDTYDYAANELVTFKASKKSAEGQLTTGSGAPVEIYKATSTMNTKIFENQYFVEALSHMNRERVPERAVHPGGTGAHGYFEVTKDVTQYTRANFLGEVGKQTPVFARFSMSFKDKGSPDSARGGRGMAVKLYTEEGNLDLTGLHTPLFSIVDPVNVPSFVHINKRNPVTDILDNNAIWDFISYLPEQLNQLIYAYSDSGLPSNWRNMNSFMIHTFEVENKNGDLYYVRFSFNNNQGGGYLTNNESLALAASDPDYFKRDLYNAIASGNYPSWTLNMQIMTYEETQCADFDVFSVNKIWPLEDYPYHEVGRLVLNRNPTNFFNDVEQAAFGPGNLVPGINGGIGGTFIARSFAYRDTQYHRIGPNFLDLPINKAQNKILNYIRDGSSNGFIVGAGPNYYPNSFYGPQPYVFTNKNNNTLIGKFIALERDDDNLFGQSIDYYLSLSADARLRLASTFASNLSKVTITEIRQKAVEIISQIHAELADNILGFLNGTISA